MMLPDRLVLVILPAKEHESPHVRDEIFGGQ